MEKKFFSISFAILFYEFALAFFAWACYNRAMKNERSNEKQVFKFTLSMKMILLSILAIILSVAGIIVSSFRIARSGEINGFIEALQSPLLIFVCAACIVIVLSILIKSQYVIDGEHYTTQFGFIKSTFYIKDITALELDSDTKKLTIFIGEQYSVLSLKAEWHDAFIKALRDVNTNIDFTFTLAQGETKKDNKKK